MKELDFLPDWYRANRQRSVRRQRHYVLFGLVVALTVCWSFIVGHSVSGLQAETRQVETMLENGRLTLETATTMEQEIARLRRQADVLETLSPRTAVSAALAELSACINEQIILSRVTLTLEPIAGAASGTTAAGGIVRLGAAKPAAGASPLPDGPQRTRITLTGAAAGGAEVAMLIERLEQSVYFDAVSPGYSRAKKIGTRDVTEFEISCTVADYEVKR